MMNSNNIFYSKLLKIKTTASKQTNKIKISNKQTKKLISIF